MGVGGDCPSWGDSVRLYPVTQPDESARVETIDRVPITMPILPVATAAMDTGLAVQPDGAAGGGQAPETATTSTASLPTLPRGVGGGLDPVLGIHAVGDAVTSDGAPAVEIRARERGLSPPGSPPDGN